MILNAIVAVGNDGQVGLNGKLPWHDPVDLSWFKELTANGVLICGYNTFQTLPKLGDGRVVVMDDTSLTPSEFVSKIETDKPIWIIGGPKTYERYAPLITRWHVGKIDYDGPADTCFNYNLLGI